jgi:uncharacterized protein
MQLEQQFELPLPPAAVWPAFGDIALLVGCLPGATLAGEEADGQWPLRFDLKLGPVAASFGGQGRLTRDDATLSGRFEGQASDRKTGSRVKGAAAFALAPAGAGTRVKVTVDYTLTGALAQVGRGGIVKELAGALTAQFAANLQQRLAAAVPAIPEPLEAAALGDMAPLAAGALLWQALCRWLGRWFSHRRSTP